MTLQPLPGAKPFPPELARRLLAALAAKGKDDVARTHHRNPDGSPRYTNRLILETSPYLLQHAHNPVNWYPWGEEAFARAAAEQKPVLLSVGYSTCHWCHVMEAESFEDEEIAAFLNEHFIAIKVDREERPDVDGVYMSFVQLTTGSGGWPMTVFLTPERQPFFGGTYFPPRDGVRGARVGFLTLLHRIHEAYEKDREGVVAQAKKIAEELQKYHGRGGGKELPGADLLEEAQAAFSRAFDDAYGGFGSAPKFPRSMTLDFLLRHHRRTENRRSLEMVTKTLDAMARGGIYDQIGGGFHRYATDRRWLVPHFEKMLYDNALLAVTYLEAYQATGQEAFAQIARETLDYIDREMSAPEGGFFSATDADSEGEEGKFFVWTPDEIDALLGPEEGRIVKTYYDVTPQGNFEGKNILHRPLPDEAVAGRLGIDVATLRATIEGAKKKLYAHRAKRVPPLTDTKVLAAWNGLTISAFARGAFVLDVPRYRERAIRAGRFLLDRMYAGGRLMRSFKDGAAKQAGFLNDYVFVAEAFLDLYEVTFEPVWLTKAIALQEVLEAHFRDAKGGGWFLTSDEHESLLFREKPAYDGAIPSGNSAIVLNLLRFYEFTTEDRYRQRAEETLGFLSGTLEQSPTSLPRALCGLDFLLDRAKEIVLVEPAGGGKLDPFLARLRSYFLPNRILVAVREGKPLDALAATVPLVEGKIAQEGKVTAYVCEAGRCELPTTDPAIFARQLQDQKEKSSSPSGQ